MKKRSRYLEKNENATILSGKKQQVCDFYVLTAADFSSKKIINFQI
ncbi:MAG TPA: hypothetical protein VF273_02890 [Pelobium sp.]